MLQTTSQEKDTMKEILAMMTNLCQKLEKIETDVQVLKEKVNSQQHDSKYAELSQQHDLKNAELESDDGKHLKTKTKRYMHLQEAQLQQEVHLQQDNLQKRRKLR